MNRREILAAGLGAGLTMVAVAEAQPKPAEPKRAPPPVAPLKVDPRAALLASLQHCLAAAQACAAHCDVELAQGNKTFARCAATVADMLAIGWATQGVVARKSALSKKIVEACAAACKDCSAACLEHKPHWSHGMHAECKACMDACDACLRTCNAFLAA